MLAVYGPGARSWHSDDFLPGALDPLVEIEAPEAGEYLVHVLGFAPGAAGPYQVGLARLTPNPGAGLDSGGSAAGALAPGGAGPGIAAAAELWVEARGGERLRFRVVSPEFDTVAALVAPTGQVWVNDDAGDTGPDGTERPLDSTLLVIAPVPGVYHLIVSSYGGRGAGAFRVRSTRQPAVVLAEGAAVPDVGYAGPEGRGRLLGLFAGITDYQGGSGNLYGCADDATLLAEAFRARGLMAPDQQTILTDLNANRAAFTAGLQQLAARSTENDVVVIFYSGHGGTVPRAETDRFDIDGTDETLVLVDGPMRDDEVVGLIDSIRAGTIILALDACHSGGFARDFLSRPGRIGLFSSDEDVLSDTAEPLRAGGYLSYTLRRAVLGEGDFSPADGALFAGELTDYLHGAFVRHHDHINPAESNQPRQWLVSNRGSVGWSDLLWLYPRTPAGELPPIPALPLESAPPGGAAPAPTAHARPARCVR
jgi:hypothetical protein